MGGDQGMKKFGPVVALAVLAGSLFSGYVWPPEQGELKLFQDQALAERYAPVIAQGEGIEPAPDHLYYLMADSPGRIFIAYHVSWPYEKDETKGLAAAFNKVFYTGGLKLQKKIFGPEDIEVVELVIDKQSGEIARVRYESAEVEKKGNKVKQNHQGREAENVKPPVYFETITWNHMFALISPEELGARKVYQLQPEYFSAERWEYYKMAKKRRSLFSQDRAYFSWEVEPKPGK